MNNTTKIPEHIFCTECEKTRMHMAFEMILPDGLWSWHILAHDGMSIFQWPTEFESKKAAKDHIASIIEKAENEIEGEHDE